jgi:hypothetical protein
VIPATCYFAWTRREDLESLTSLPTFRALPPMVLLILLWLLGNLTNTAIVQQFCVVATVAGLAGVHPQRALLRDGPAAVRAAAGRANRTSASRLHRQIRGEAAPVLRRTCSSRRACHLDPRRRWQVAEACGGINYLVSSLAVGYVFAGTAYLSWTRRISFFAASAVCPLLQTGFACTRPF